MIHPVHYQNNCNIYSNLFLNLEELIIDVVGKDSSNNNYLNCYNLNCSNLKKIVIENIFRFENMYNFAQNPQKFTIEARLAIPNAILVNGYRVCEFHKTNLTNTTCSICDQIRTVPEKLKEFCDRESIQYKIIM